MSDNQTLRLIQADIRAIRAQVEALRMEALARELDGLATLLTLASQEVAGLQTSGDDPIPNHRYSAVLQ